MQFGIIELVLVSLTGGGVGFLSGVFGVGGGFLIVPLLNIALGIPMEFAVGAGACQMLGPATTSLIARRIEREYLRLPLIMSGGLLLGVFLGASVLELAQRKEASATDSEALPVTEIVVLLTYFLLLVGVGCFSIWEAWRSRTRGDEMSRGWIADWKIPPYTRLPGILSGRISILVITWFGLGVGFLSGLLGIGGGIILLPGLIYLWGLSTHASIFSTLVIVWIVSAQATIVHAWHENIDLTLVMALLIGGTAGARLGSELSVKLGGRQLRQYFGWLLLVVAVIIAGKLALLLL